MTGKLVHVWRTSWWPEFCFMLLVGLGGGCEKKNEYIPPPPPAVTVEHPTEREIVHELEFTGTTRASESVDVRARVNGYLKAIQFEDGANVEAGDVLFVIEAAPFEAALDSANAALMKAKASLALAEADLARTEPLFQRGALTKSELDVKKAAVATGLADVASANAAIRLAELNVSYTQVKSPCSGRVSRHLVDVGNLVTAETTMLTRVEVFDPIHAYFSVSESDVLELLPQSQQGGSARDGNGNVARESLPSIFLALAGDEGFPYAGQVDFAELGIDSQTGTQLRRGLFRNPDGKLVPGLFVRLRLPIGAASPRILVPDRAIATDQRGEYVLAVNDKNIVEYRPVKLGLRVDRMRVVSEGVNRDDWIVVNGLQRARPGSAVKPEKSPLEMSSDGGSPPPTRPATSAAGAPTTSAAGDKVPASR